MHVFVIYFMHVHLVCVETPGCHRLHSITLCLQVSNYVITASADLGLDIYEAPNPNDYIWVYNQQGVGTLHLNIESTYLDNTSVQICSHVNGSSVSRWHWGRPASGVTADQEIC